jgi:membrane-bound serine protease (ClpP class)
MEGGRAAVITRSNKIFATAALLGAWVTVAFADVAAPPAPPSPPPESTGRAFEIPIDGEIELGLAAFVTRVLKEATAGDTVILHINTFGGRVDAAVQIRDALLASKARTVAFIDSRAISAGALISLATDVITMSRGATIGAATPVQLEGGKMAPVEAKVVSYFRKEMKATAEAKGRRGDIAEAMVDAAVEIPGLDGKETTLTLTVAEALKYKIANFQAESLAEVCTHLRIAEPSVIKPGINWAERIARFLSEGTISSLLMSLGMLGILIELWAPGHAVAGVLGVLCLLAFFFGHYVVHLAGWEELLAFAVGAALVIVELIAFPGHGSIAVVGVLMIIGSLVAALLSVKHVPLEISWSLGWVTSALARVFGSLMITTVAMFFVSRALPRTRFGRALILEDAVTGKASAHAPVQVGAEGVAETVLRPAGKARFGELRVDVVSEGGFIERGDRVTVVSTDGGKIVVKRS